MPHLWPLQGVLPEVRHVPSLPPRIGAQGRDPRRYQSVVVKDGKGKDYELS